MTFGVIQSNLAVKSHMACLDMLGLGHQRHGVDRAVCFLKAFSAK